MESDLSLIEISGEDDSLLQQIPALDNTTTTTINYFSCSPLQVPRSKRSTCPSRGSPIIGLKNNVDVDKSTYSSSRARSNKENINVNKSEEAKLSVEPQQMKRQKRGGGYNLRKSLAWNRAFFTEEGVLNSVELSMLSGTIGDSIGEVLPIIREEGRMLSGNSGSSSDSADLQGTPKILSNQRGNKTASKGSGCPRPLALSSYPLSGNSGSTSDSADLQGTPKILSNQRGNRTAPKGSGCPRPLALSSLKRPSNAITTKDAMKGSKLPRIPVSRSGPCSLPTTNKSNVLGNSHSKHNQIAQSDIGLKSTGSKGSSKIAIIAAANKVKAGSNCSSLTAKSSRQHPRRNMGYSFSEIHSSTNSRPPLVSKTNGGLEVVPDLLLPPNGSHEPVARDASRKIGVPLPQSTQSIGGKGQYTQFQTTKPSGLRMPSPSLGFFGQPKFSASNSSSWKATQPSDLPESCIPSLRRLDASNYRRDPKLPHGRGKILKGDNDGTLSRNARASGASTGCSVLAAVNDVSLENVKLKLEVSNVPTVEVTVPRYSKSCELIKENQEVHNVIDSDKEFQEYVEPHKVYQSSSKEDTELLMNGDKLLLVSGSPDQFKKDSNHELTIACPEFRDSRANDLENYNFASQHSSVVLVKGVPETTGIIKHPFLEDKQYSSSVRTQGVIFESQSRYVTSDIKQGLGITHDGHSSNICDVDEQSWEKAELINPSAGEADQIPAGENHNLMITDGLLLENRKLLESQKYKSKNSANVNPKLCASSGSDVHSSYSPRLSTAELANGGASGVDQLTDKSHVGDIQVHFLDGTLLVESCDNKLRTSVFHDQDLGVDDDNERSGEHPKLQTPYLVVEQASKLNHGFLSNDTSLLSEGTPSEELQVLNNLEATQNVILERDDCGSEPNCSNVVLSHDPRAIHDGPANVPEMVEQPKVEAALSSAAEAALSCAVEVVPPVESHKCSIDIQFRPDLSLKTRRDHMTGAVTTCNSMTSCSLRKEEDLGVNGLKNNILVAEAETKVSSDNPHENDRIKMNGVILCEVSRYCDEFQNGDLVNNADVSSINQGSDGSELKSCHSPSQLENTEQVSRGAAGIDNIANELRMGNAKVQSLDENLLVGSNQNDLSTPSMDGQCSMVVTDVNEQSLEQSELQTSCLVNDHVTQDNNGLHLNGYSLLGKSTSLEEHQKEKVVANVAYVQEQSDVDVSESKSSNVVFQVPLSMQDRGVDVESMAEHPLAKDAPSGSVDTETSAEHDKYFIDIHLRHDMACIGQATSLEFDSALTMSEDQTSGVANTYKAFCSFSEESDLLVKKIQTSDETNAVGVEVDGIKSILPDEIEVEISQNIVSPTGELHHKLDNAMCLTENEDATMPINKSEDGRKRNSLMIKPPVNAVPFSDEWLAAIEAAGEEILTMKGGAVQNSPPDKSLPEPGPWSPVKRKQNQTGPFDCTKFINIPPPSSN